MTSAQPILLNPGPVNVSDAVRSALGRGDLCHREPEFAELLERVRRGLLDALGVEKTHDAVFLTGSGTAAVEVATIAAVRAGRKLAVVDNGVYGARIAAMARAHGIEVVTIESGWTEPPDPARVARALEDPAVDALALVHHETTTGLANPVAPLARLAREAGKLVVVDTVSGLAGEPIDLDLFDLAASTANKCIGGMPGVSFVLVREAAAARLSEVPRRSVYLDLMGYRGAQRAGAPLFTPAIQVLFALEQAIHELAEEGLERRIERFRGVAAFLRERFAALALELLLRPELRSNTITTVRLPRGWTYAALHDALREKGFVIYAGQGSLGGEIFRVANMGRVATADYERFARELGGILG